MKHGVGTENDYARASGVPSERRRRRKLTSKFMKAFPPLVGEPKLTLARVPVCSVNGRLSHCVSVRAPQSVRMSWEL